MEESVETASQHKFQMCSILVHGAVAQHDDAIYPTLTMRLGER
jgi:hypothetical protein